MRERGGEGGEAVRKRHMGRRHLKRITADVSIRVVYPHTSKWKTFKVRFDRYGSPRVYGEWIKARLKP